MTLTFQFNNVFDNIARINRLSKPYGEHVLGLLCTKLLSILSFLRHNMIIIKKYIYGYTSLHAEHWIAAISYLSKMRG